MAKDKKENLTGMGKEELLKKLQTLRDTARAPSRQNLARIWAHAPSKNHKGSHGH